MAAPVYIVGLRSGTGKKSGKWYGMISLLTLNNFGNWCIMEMFAENSDVYDAACDLGIGSAVVISVAFPSNALSGIIEDESRDSLPLDNS